MKEPLHNSRGGYSPVLANANGNTVVELTEDHPGFSDVEYRERRNAIAQLSLTHQVGQPIPYVLYTDREHDVWRYVSEELAPKHEESACSFFLDAKESLRIPTDHIPQLGDVGDLLSPVCGFRYEPVPGLAPLREFYGSFAHGTFFSTQYIRHHSEPKYTPEPDLIHEVIGHANQLGDPRVADIYSAVGGAVQRSTTHNSLEFLSKIFWFTMEFGVVFEHGKPKAYGAGILSSFGELDVFQGATIRPLNLSHMGAEEYDITKYQPILYSFDSPSQMFDQLLEFFSTYDDSVFAAMTSSRSEP